MTALLGREDVCKGQDFPCYKSIEACVCFYYLMIVAQGLVTLYTSLYPSLIEALIPAK